MLTSRHVRMPSPKHACVSGPCEHEQDQGGSRPNSARDTSDRVARCLHNPMKLLPAYHCTAYKHVSTAMRPDLVDDTSNTNTMLPTHHYVPCNTPLYCILHQRLLPSTKAHLASWGTGQPAAWRPSDCLARPGPSGRSAAAVGHRAWAATQGPATAHAPPASCPEEPLLPLQGAAARNAHAAELPPRVACLQASCVHETGFRV